MANKDAILVFYSIDYERDGSIANVEFNFVKRVNLLKHMINYVIVIVIEKGLIVQNGYSPLGSRGKSVNEAI